VGKGKKVLLFLLPLPTKQWNLPLATELGSSFTSFHLLLLKGANSDHLELSSGHDFQFQIFIILVPTTFIGKRKMDNLGR
jgi:hypothetical protein